MIIRWPAGWLVAAVLLLVACVPAMTSPADPSESQATTLPSVMGTATKALTATEEVAETTLYTNQVTRPPTAAPPSEPTATARNITPDAGHLSEQGLFRVSYSSELDPTPINQIHVWTLHLATADGQPVENAAITVDGAMPDHGHGLPTQPQVTEDLGGGDYRVEGMKFNMPGYWTVTFHIAIGDQSDAVTFDLTLN